MNIKNFASFGMLCIYFASSKYMIRMGGWRQNMTECCVLPKNVEILTPHVIVLEVYHF